MALVEDSPAPAPSTAETRSPEHSELGQALGPGGDRGSRIVGIDLARGIALLGMFTVHVFVFGPDGEAPTGIMKWLLEVPSGRASVLFFLLSGISLSVIDGRGSSSAQPGVLRRRGAVLILVGLVLSSGPWPASILEHYGVMFLTAPLLLRRSNRQLVGLAAAGMVAGPILLLFTRGLADDVAGVSDGAGGWVLETLWSLGIAGTYPMVVWFGFFALGVRTGRLDLHAKKVAGALFAAGVSGVLLIMTATWALGTIGVEAPAAGDVFDEGSSIVLDDPGDIEAIENMTDAEFAAFIAEQEGFDDIGDVEPSRGAEQLLSTEPHSGQVGWTLQAMSVAFAVLGAALLLPRAGHRLLWPITALGSMSLTAYLLHTLLVTDAWEATVGDGFSDPTWSIDQQVAMLVGLQIVLVVLCSVITWRWKKGPAERLLTSLTSR